LNHSGPDGSWKPTCSGRPSEADALRQHRRQTRAPSRLVGELRRDLNQFALAPWLSVFPGLAIVITVLSINLFGDDLCDALDPRQQR
jgi:hypothetical protein